MTPFRLEREFRGGLDDFWAVYFDRAYTEECYKRVRARECTIVRLDDEGDVVRRTLRIVPERDLPAVVRKIVGASLGWIEESTLYRAENRCDIVVTPTVLADRSTITFDYRVSAVADDRVLRTCDGSVEIRVPVVGGRIERLIVEDMMASYEAGADLTQEFLDRRILRP